LGRQPHAAQGSAQATLEAVQVPGSLRLRVSDDGTGGARVEAHGGLAGLADRVRTVDGRLQLSSPPGGSTVISAELPSPPDRTGAPDADRDR
jgi:signal transduction histidine kinase